MIEQESLTIKQAAQRLKTRYNYPVSGRAVLSWASVGRMIDGQRVFLPTQQFGAKSAHTILASDLDDYVNRLRESSLSS